MTEYGPSYNKGYRHVLLTFDKFSKNAWTTPFKNLRAQTVTDAFSEFIKTSIRQPNLIETNDRKEYVDKIFTDFFN